MIALSVGADLGISQVVDTNHGNYAGSLPLISHTTYSIKTCVHVFVYVYVYVWAGWVFVCFL